MVRRLSLTFGALGLLLLSGSPGIAGGVPASGASARAFAIKVVVPGGGGGTPEVTAPGDKVQFGGGFAYPADGSIVTTGPVTASASAHATETTATASASSEVTTLILFGGEVTAAQVTGRATASARTGQEATADLSGAAVSGLTVLGQPAAAGGRVELGDWGYAILYAQGAAPDGDGYRGFVTALDIHLTADHGGLPAGSEILVGYAEAAAVAAPPPPETTTETTSEPPVTATAPPPPPARSPKSGKAAAKPKAPRVRIGRPLVPPIVRRPLPTLIPKLTKGGYVFPVHGPASFTDTFGAARAVVNWHHGEDIFAPMGAPVLAVAKGTVFSVGWNDVGGNRLWLRDTEGNEFYYAHLSAFSPLAVDGAHVQAGDVLGFVGNSGDAETTPPHLHFEIHPVGLLGLGYDGVINPHEALLKWRRLEDLRFVAGATWTVRAGGSVGVAQVSDAPRPGAFLLSSSDISTASGLDPGSLERAMDEPASAEAATGSSRSVRR